MAVGPADGGVADLSRHTVYPEHSDVELDEPVALVLPLRVTVARVATYLAVGDGRMMLHDRLDVDPRPEHDVA